MPGFFPVPWISPPGEGLGPIGTADNVREAIAVYIHRDVN
jgi:hypothetical protein